MSFIFILHFWIISPSRKILLNNRLNNLAREWTQWCALWIVNNTSLKNKNLYKSNTANAYCKKWLLCERLSIYITKNHITLTYLLDIYSRWCFCDGFNSFCLNIFRWKSTKKNFWNRQKMLGSWEKDIDEIDNKNSGVGITLIKARNELIYSFQPKNTNKSSETMKNTKTERKKCGKREQFMNVFHIANLSVNWRHGKFSFAASTAAEWHRTEG